MGSLCSRQRERSLHRYAAQLHAQHRNIKRGCILIRGHHLDLRQLVHEVHVHSRGRVVLFGAGAICRHNIFLVGHDCFGCKVVHRLSRWGEGDLRRKVCRSISIEGELVGRPVIGAIRKPGACSGPANQCVGKVGTTIAQRSDVEGSEVIGCKRCPRLNMEIGIKMYFILLSLIDDRVIRAAPCQHGRSHHHQRSHIISLFLFLLLFAISLHIDVDNHLFPIT